MKHSRSPDTRARRRARRFVLGLAQASLASACSGNYPLGETSHAQGFVGDEGRVLRNQTGDARVAASLAPPDFSIDGEGAGNQTLASVGDLDGDGRDDMAVGSIDFSTGVAFVHLRYGGPRPRDAAEVFAFEQSGARLPLALDGGYALYVGGAGDVDGDGFDDLLIKTGECAVLEPGAGTYLVYGGPERLEGVVPLASRAVRFAPPVREHPNLQRLVCDLYPLAAGPGDIDGDGFDDILITSAPLLDDSGSPEPGTGEGVYLFYGRSQRFAGDVPFAAADASFHAALPVNPYALGDMNGDGLADVVLGPDVYTKDPPGSFWLAGGAQRWSGSLDLAASATLLEGAFLDTIDRVHSHGDLDGDGLDEVLLRTADGTRHLFYGAPDLFAGGIDFAKSEATFGGLASYVYPVADRDGDGDDELLDQFYNPATSVPMPFFSSNVAFASGSPERLSGNVVFPESEVIAQTPDGPFPEALSRSRQSGRALNLVIPAGDLDGDGAADLFTTSQIFDIIDESAFEQSTPQVHIHYGTPALPGAPALR